MCPYMADIVRKNISLYPQHQAWIEMQEEQNENWNFSEWVRTKIEEEGGDMPAFIQ